jgi:hypothetical protein
MCGSNSSESSKSPGRLTRKLVRQCYELAGTYPFFPVPVLRTSTTGRTLFFQIEPMVTNRPAWPPRRGSGPFSPPCPLSTSMTFPGWSRTGISCSHPPDFYKPCIPFTIAFRNPKASYLDPRGYSLLTEASESRQNQRSSSFFKLNLLVLFRPTQNKFQAKIPPQ